MVPEDIGGLLMNSAIMGLPSDPMNVALTFTVTGVGFESVSLVVHSPLKIICGIEYVDAHKHKLNRTMSVNSLNIRMSMSISIKYHKPDLRVA